MELQTVEDYIKANLTESVHTSARRSFRGCRRRYSYIFRNFWYPTVTAKPLEFGVAYHKAKQTMYDPEMWADRESSAAAALVVFKQAVEEQRKKYRETVGELSQEAEADYDERVKLGLGMLKHYSKRFLHQETLTPIRVEIKFEVPIRHSDGRELWCKCNNCWNRYVAWIKLYRPDWDADEHIRDKTTWKGLPVTYGGRIDVLFVDEYGRIWIGDWKTTARMMENDQFLLLDDQITSYCWAMWLLGIDVAGFLYIEIKKSFPQEPEPMARRRLGLLYSVSKSADYEYESYVKTVEENDPIAYQNGSYDDYIEWLRDNGTPYHARHQIERSEEELRIAGDNIFLEASDMVDPDLKIYPSPGRFACQFCAFQEPCLAENRGDDTDYLLGIAYEKREYHYWEKTKPSTDGKGGE